MGYGLINIFIIVVLSLFIIVIFVLIGAVIYSVWEWFIEKSDEIKKRQVMKRISMMTKTTKKDMTLENIGFMEIPLLVDCELFYVNRRTGMEITFYLEDKHISIAGGSIDVNLYKAIGAKMEELGW